MAPRPCIVRLLLLSLCVSLPVLATEGIPLNRKSILEEAANIEESASSPCSLDCQNGATCSRSPVPLFCDCSTIKPQVKSRSAFDDSVLLSDVIPENNVRFVGKFCEHAVPNTVTCQTSFCVNGGLCRKAATGDQQDDEDLDLEPCNCPANFTGKHCEFAIDQVPACELECGLNGICRHGRRGKTSTATLDESILLQAVDQNQLHGNNHCECREGYIGRNCELPARLCPDQNIVCLYNAPCVQRTEFTGTSFSFRCDCESIDRPGCEINLKSVAAEKEASARLLQNAIPSPSPSVTWYPTQTWRPTTTWYPTETLLPTITWLPTASEMPAFSHKHDKPRRPTHPGGGTDDFYNKQDDDKATGPDDKVFSPAPTQTWWPSPAPSWTPGVPHASTPPANSENNLAAASTSTGTAKKGISGGGVFGILFVLAVVIGGIFFYWRRTKRLPHSSRRPAENLNFRSDLELTEAPAGYRDSNSDRLI